MKRYDDWMKGVAALTEAADQERGAVASIASQVRKAVASGDLGFVEAVAKAALLQYQFSGFDPDAMAAIRTRYCYAADPAALSG